MKLPSGRPTASKRAADMELIIAVALIVMTWLAVGWYVFLHSGPNQLAREFLYGRKGGTELESLENLRQLALALRRYADDHGGTAPYWGTLDEELKPYVTSEKIFRDPGTDEPYVFQSYSPRKLVEISNPAETVCFYEPSPGDDGTLGVAFVDGSARRVTAAEWPPIREASKLPSWVGPHYR